MKRKEERERERRRRRTRDRERGKAPSSSSSPAATFEGERKKKRRAAQLFSPLPRFPKKQRPHRDVRFRRRPPHGKDHQNFNRRRRHAEAPQDFVRVLRPEEEDDEAVRQQPEHASRGRRRRRRERGGRGRGGRGRGEPLEREERNGFQETQRQSLGLSFFVLFFFSVFRVSAANHHAPPQRAPFSLFFLILECPGA